MPEALEPICHFCIFYELPAGADDLDEQECMYSPAPDENPSLPCQRLDAVEADRDELRKALEPFAKEGRECQKVNEATGMCKVCRWHPCDNMKAAEVYQASGEEE